MDNFALIKQGAEGRIYKGPYLGREVIAKERFVKKYRHPELDSQLTKERMKSECRAIVRCKAAGIRTPAIYLVDFKRRMIFMEYIDHSITVKDYITSYARNSAKVLAHNIGGILGTMHLNNIIHGDLTTSNILLANKNNVQDFDKMEDLDIVLIDFGLAHLMSSAEDKGVDLYVLERALLSTHSEAEQIFEGIMEGYKNQYTGSKEVLAKYEEVRARGRKRTMVG